MMTHGDWKDEETRYTGDHSNHEISVEDESHADKVVNLGVPGLPFHDVALGFLEGEADGRNQVSTTADADALDGGEGGGYLK